jgi:hypothetical protein
MSYHAFLHIEVEAEVKLLVEYEHTQQQRKWERYDGYFIRIIKMNVETNNMKI